MADALKVLINVEQRRLQSPRLGMTAEKFDFNNVLYSNTWIEPVTGTVMLEPAPISPTWDTTNTGIYSRLTLSDFRLTASATGWNTANNRGAGAVRIIRQSGMSSSVSTTSSYGVNRPFYVSFFTYNVENSSTGIFFECGWSNTGNGTQGVSLRWRTNGVVEVWKDGTQVGSGQIGIQGGAVTSNNYANYLIIPYRRRDLLIYSLTSGDGFVHTFEDIAEDATNPVITDDDPFWFYVPTASVNVELAPVQFPSSGYVTSFPIALATAPAVGRTLESRANDSVAPSVTNAYVLGDQPQIGGTDTTNVVSAVSVRTTAGSTFTPNGSTSTVILRVDMTGDGDYTPFVYAAHAAYEAIFANTDDSEEFDLTPYILKSPGPTLTVPDDPGGVEFTFTVKSPYEIQDNDVPNFLTIGNRPCKVMIGSNVLIDGILLEPEFTDAVYDAAARLQCTVKDRMMMAQNLQLRERIPFDGVPMCEAEDPSVYWDSMVQFLYYQAGVANANMDLDAVGFILPKIPNSSQTEAISLQNEIGATIFEELARLVSTYAAGFLWGMKPKGSGALPDAVFKDPDNLSTTPDLTLYRTGADAVAAGKPATQVYYSYTEKPLAIEANEVRCTGYDVRTRRSIQAFKVDTSSQDVTLAPSLQPDNWLGEPRVFGVIDPRFTTQDAVNRAVEAIFPKSTARYYIGSFTSEMLFKTDGSPVWRGDLIRLDGRRDLRISALNVAFLLEDSGDIVVREASYTGGTILNRGGATLDVIGWQAQRAAVRKTLNYNPLNVISVQTPSTSEAL